MNGFTANQQAFLNNLKANYPALYRVAMNAAKGTAAAQSLSGMGDIDWSGMFSKITDAVTKAAPAVLQYKQQKKLLAVQVDRARQNLPPIAPEQYAQYATPATAVSAEAPYSGFNVQPYAGGAPVSKTLIYVGAGVAALAALFLIMRKR